MAYIGDAGDTSEIQDEDMNQTRSYKLLEPGWYRAALSKDEAQTKDWGVGLSMEFTILQGDFENMRIFEYLCVQHRKEDPERIARTRLKELAVAAGYSDPNHVTDTSPMYGVPVMIEIYRAKEKEAKYADEDGRKARVAQFMSVAQWKAEKSDEPLPGVTRGSTPPPIKPVAPPPPPPMDDDIPF